MRRESVPTVARSVRRRSILGHPVRVPICAVDGGSKELGIPPFERLKHEHRLIPQTS